YFVASRRATASESKPAGREPCRGSGMGGGAVPLPERLGGHGGRRGVQFAPSPYTCPKPPPATPPPPWPSSTAQAAAELVVHHPFDLVESRGVRKSFCPKVVYSDLTLDIHEGESITIIGGSGQGKSVMLKMLVGLTPVDSGLIQYDGSTISTLPEREYSTVRQ